MKTIWKYGLNPASAWTTRLPAGAVVLSVGFDPNEQLSMWVAVDPDVQDTALRTFCVIGTGHDLPNGCEFLATVRQGSFMWHVFEQVSNLVTGRAVEYCPPGTFDTPKVKP